MRQGAENWLKMRDFYQIDKKRGIRDIARIPLVWCPHADSNGDQQFRKLLLYPVELWGHDTHVHRKVERPFLRPAHPKEAGKLGISNDFGEGAPKTARHWTRRPRVLNLPWVFDATGCSSALVSRPAGR